MLFEFVIITLSIVIFTWIILALVDSASLGSSALACIPVVFLGGPSLGIMFGLYYLEYLDGVRPHINITFE